jgi:hypothetical protein
MAAGSSSGSGSGSGSSSRAGRAQLKGNPTLVPSLLVKNTCSVTKSSGMCCTFSSVRLQAGTAQSAQWRHLTASLV